MARLAASRCPTLPLRHDRNAELLLIAEASRWLSEAQHTQGVEAVRSVTAMLIRQQRLAACRAQGRPLDA